MSTLNLFFLLAVFLVAAALFAAGETALLALPRIRLRRLARQKTLFRQTLDNPHRVLVGLLLGSTLANVAATSVSALLVNRLFGHSLPLAALLLLQVLSMSFILLVFCEVAPKTYALEHGEGFAVRMAPLLRLLGTVLRPFVNLLEGVSLAGARLLAGRAGRPSASKISSRSSRRASCAARSPRRKRGSSRERSACAGAPPPP